MKNRPLRAFLFYLTITVGAGCYYLLAHCFFPVHSLYFRTVTGWLCPGCGITRMMLHLGSGDLAAAFGDNPVLFCCFPSFSLYGGDDRQISKRNVSHQQSHGSGTLDHHGDTDFLGYSAKCSPTSVNPLKAALTGHIPLSWNPDFNPHRPPGLLSPSHPSQAGPGIPKTPFHKPHAGPGFQRNPTHGAHWACR